MQGHYGNIKKSKEAARELSHVCDPAMIPLSPATPLMCVDFYIKKNIFMI
jgi:hypothetical protein